jgi:hypothetical protein
MRDKNSKNKSLCFAVFIFGVAPDPTPKMWRAKKHPLGRVFLPCGRIFQKKRKRAKWAKRPFR